MEVRLFPNSSRPGVGLKPRRESQRPLLPQHARHCPVLEAGRPRAPPPGPGGAGPPALLLSPPLEAHESYYLSFLGEGKYEFTYFLSGPGGKWQPLFCLTITMPIGSVGMMKEDVAFMVPDPPIS